MTPDPMPEVGTGLDLDVFSILMTAMIDTHTLRDIDLATSAVMAAVRRYHPWGGPAVNPTQTCVACDRRRDCYLHLRAEHPPSAAKAWLKRTCETEGKPCEFKYTAAFALMGPIVGQRGEP